jgi:hypothetical protein
MDGRQGAGINLGGLGEGQMTPNHKKVTKYYTWPWTWIDFLE